MKIAVASEKGMVTGHFGHCENFMVFNAEDNKIVGTESVPNPGHKPGFLPNYLNDMGVNVIISAEWAGSNRHLQSAQHRGHNRCGRAFRRSSKIISCRRT